MRLDRIIGWIAGLYMLGISLGFLGFSAYYVFSNMISRPVVTIAIAISSLVLGPLSLYSSVKMLKVANNLGEEEQDLQDQLRELEAWYANWKRKSPGHRSTEP